MDEINVKSYIPDLYLDRVNQGDNPKDIPDTTSGGFYRFYGLFMDESLVGSIKYHIMPGYRTAAIDIIEVDSSLRGRGLGTMLINTSLKDIESDYPFLERVTVCSFSSAISFYRQNDFTPYFGDNNLVRSLLKK